jgi:hypothetical protein
MKRCAEHPPGPALLGVYLRVESTSWYSVLWKHSQQCSTLLLLLLVVAVAM